MILALGLVALRCKTISLDKAVIKFSKVIGHTENFSNFVSRDHSNVFCEVDLS